VGEFTEHGGSEDDGGGWLGRDDDWHIEHGGEEAHEGSVLGLRAYRSATLSGTGGDRELTAHVDRVDLVALCVHLVHDMTGLESDGLCVSKSLTRAEKRTSRAMLNFLARSLTLSSSVKPVIMPLILESASGDRSPGRQRAQSEDSLYVPCYDCQQMLSYRVGNTYQVGIKVHVLCQLR
jgi:hypothetical protein